MISREDISAGYVVDFRMDASGDGQPDFMAAFQYLERVVTAPARWLPYHRTPDFEVRTLGAEPVYVIKIWASRDALDLLKWRDVETENIRILDDFSPTDADILTISAASRLKFSSD